MTSIRIRALVAVAGLTALAGQAAAVDEIEVTAQRRAANLQEVPISVTAFQTEDIDKLQINFAADIAKNVPNMQTYTVTGGGTAVQLYMRGAGVQNPGFNASESPVGFYVDDVYRGRLASVNLDLADVERIEVLRGPQGTLYGRNTIAGAVKIITRTPTDQTWANASLGYGNFDTTKATASVGGEVADGLGASIAALYHERGEGWIKRGSVGGRELGEFDNKALRGKLNWFGGDVFSATLTGEFFDAENDGYNGIPYGPSFDPPSSPGRPLEGFYDTLVPDSTVGRGDNQQENATLELEWDFGGFVVKSITGYSDIDDEFAFDLNGGASQNPAPPPDVLTGVPGFFIESWSDNETITQEINISGSTDSVDWIAGVFYMSEEGEQDYRANLGLGPFGAYTLRELSSTDTESYAIYGEGTFQVNSRFSITAGLRWTLDEKDYANDCRGTLCRAGGPPPFPPPAMPMTWGLDLDENFNEFTPRLILNYQATDDTLLFAGVSRGFQAGGFQTLCFGNQGCNSVIYSPQTVVSWEAGIKTDLADDTVRFNASTFYAQYSELQQTAIDTASGSFPVQNVGGVDVLGLEVEAYWTPVENLDLFATVGLVDESFDSSTKTQLPGTSRLPGLPRRTLRAGFDYRLPVLAGWDLRVGADVNYADDYYATISNALVIDSYSRVNGRLGLEQPDGPWSVFLNGQNLTDSDDLVSGIAGNGTNIRTPQPPREYMLTVNYRY